MSKIWRNANIQSDILNTSLSILGWEEVPGSPIKCAGLGPSCSGSLSKPCRSIAITSWPFSGSSSIHPGTLGMMTPHSRALSTQSACFSVPTGPGSCFIFSLTGSILLGLQRPSKVFKPGDNITKCLLPKTSKPS